MVICLQRGADLHMAQLMPLPLIASVKSRLLVPFWYRLTRVVPVKGPLYGCVCLCACVLLYNMTSGCNNFNDFPEIVPTREITTKTEKTFLVSSSAIVGLFLERAAASIAPTSIGD